MCVGRMDGTLRKDHVGIRRHPVLDRIAQPNRVRIGVDEILTSANKVAEHFDPSRPQRPERAVPRETNRLQTCGLSECDGIRVEPVDQNLPFASLLQRRKKIREDRNVVPAAERDDRKRRSHVPTRRANRTLRLTLTS